MNDIDYIFKEDYSIVRFSAMACPCEVLIENTDTSLVRALGQKAFAEARRIEHKFSRYRDDNIIYSINHSHGERIKVDSESALLFDFANQCYQLSEGKFDITSGVLRKAWNFDGSDNIPSQHAVSQLMSFIGWDKVEWHKPTIKLAPGMQIDFGGIGKEYAVDSSLKILSQQSQCSILVNFGGDIACSGPRSDNSPWTIGVDNPEHSGHSAAGKIDLFQGGLATSGDARRFLLKDGVRYSHILNPQTGYPVANSPRSITVIANTCLEAGMLSTLAMLQGDRAVEFLKAQDVPYWCIP